MNKNFTEEYHFHDKNGEVLDSNAKALGDAHECATQVSELDEKEMDLNNNDWGYLYGDTMSYVDESHFYTSFMASFQDGQIKILQECQVLNNLYRLFRT